MTLAILIDGHHLTCSGLFVVFVVAVKTNPPSDVKVIAEKDFPTSLLIRWVEPIAKEYVKLTYQIRFCPHGSHSWTYVSILVSLLVSMYAFLLYEKR